MDDSEGWVNGFQRSEMTLWIILIVLFLVLLFLYFRMRSRRING
jgi:Mg2+ and Co2+ transporter CorA